MATQSSDIATPFEKHPRDNAVKRYIASNFWNFDIEGSTYQSKRKGFDRYFEHYHRESYLTKSDRQLHVFAETHEDIQAICTLLKEGKTRDDLRTELSQRVPPTYTGNIDEDVDSSIALAVRLLLMLEIGPAKDRFTGHKESLWQGGSLGDLITRHFEQSQALDRTHVKLETIFVGRNLKRISRINIVWTNNLADHLRTLEYEEQETQVNIFHHASFLEMAQGSLMFPEGLIEETRRSLALLFPESEETRKWFKKQASLPETDIDDNLVHCGYLKAEDRQIDNFKFWRHRLVILKEIFDDSEPSTWHQWWYDRRRGVQRYTFLLAAVALALTVLFSLVQCVVGALQVYKAYHPS